MKILYVVKNLRTSNGVTSYLMNYYRKIVSKDVKCDFLIVSDVGSDFYEEIENNGGKIYRMPSIKNFPKYIKYLKKLFKNNKYDILHSNVLNSNVFISHYAKKYGVKTRILHSHTTSNGDTTFKKIRNIPFQLISVLNSNYYFACSKLAGEKIFFGRNFEVIPNAIDLSKYSYSIKLRKEIRENNNIDDQTIVIGVVGRITAQKNPHFILKIIEELKLRKVDFKVWWIGSGDMDSEIKNLSKEKQLDDNIKYFGTISDVYKYYSAMDCFILPSIYEGLPVVGIEAQATGLKSLFSDAITTEASLTKYTEFLSIDDEKKWAERIINAKNENREDIIKSVDMKNYNIDNLAEELIKSYKEKL